MNQPYKHIRKLTPREYFRLMGVNDTDIDKIQATGISNSQQYKLAGNSIVVNVLAKIFDSLFSNDYALMGITDFDSVNAVFNQRLQQQIDGILPKNFIYELGMPSVALLRAGIDDLPIELASSRLVDKSMQENHPFELTEVFNLPQAIQQPLAVFRSATKIGAYVILTELKHKGKNFVVAMHVRPNKRHIEINDIRSIHYRKQLNIIGWIADELGVYFCPNFMERWLIPTKKELLSKPQYNSAEVRKQLSSAANVVKRFYSQNILGYINNITTPPQELLRYCKRVMRLLQ